MVRWSASFGTNSRVRPRAGVQEIALQVKPFDFRFRNFVPTETSVKTTEEGKLSVWSPLAASIILVTSALRTQLRRPVRRLIRDRETVQGSAGRVPGHQIFDEVADPLYRERTRRNCTRANVRRCSNTYTRITSVPGSASTRLRRDLMTQSQVSYCCVSDNSSCSQRFRQQSVDRFVHIKRSNP
jgi:hypothetical protein